MPDASDMDRMEAALMRKIAEAEKNTKSRMPAASLDIRDRDLPHTTRSTLGSEAQGDTIFGDMSGRVRSVDNRLSYLTDKMDMIANRMFGSRPLDRLEGAEINQKAAVERQIPALERMQSDLQSLEIQSSRLETVLERFDGLV